MVAPLAACAKDVEGKMTILRVLNIEDYAECKSNLPPDTVEYVIKGGNHSQFGSYGLQEGDNKADISAENQREQAVDAVIKNIK